MAKWFFRHNTGIIDQEFCREVICSVNDKIIILDQIHNILRSNKSTISNHVYIRVQMIHSLFCRLYFCFPQIIGTVDDLSLQVGEIYLIRICDTDGSHTGCCQIHDTRCTKSAGSDDQNLCVQQFFLSFGAYFLQNDMTGVTLKLLVTECHYFPPPMK